MYELSVLKKINPSIEFWPIRGGSFTQNEIFQIVIMVIIIIVRYNKGGITVCMCVSTYELYVYVFVD